MVHQHFLGWHTKCPCPSWVASAAEAISSAWVKKPSLEACFSNGSIHLFRWSNAKISDIGCKWLHNHDICNIYIYICVYVLHIYVHPCIICWVYITCYGNWRFWDIATWRIDVLKFSQTKVFPECTVLHNPQCHSSRRLRTHSNLRRDDIHCDHTQHGDSWSCATLDVSLAWAMHDHLCATHHGHWHWHRHHRRHGCHGWKDGPEPIFNGANGVWFLLLGLLGLCGFTKSIQIWWYLNKMFN